MSPEYLRDYLRANMFDGCEDGTMTMKTSVLLDRVVELVLDALAEPLAFETLP